MKHHICFFGTPAFALPALSTLLDHPEIVIDAVVTQPDRIAGRGNQKKSPPVKELAEKHEIRVLQPESLKGQEEIFAEFKHCSGAVVVAFGQIFPQWLINQFHNKCVNIHSSLLPRWRGAAPMQRALMAGDAKTGVCLMQVIKAMDAGPVYASAEHNISPNETFGELHDQLAQLGGQLLRDHLTAIFNGSLVGQPQSASAICYAKKIDKSEAAIDWALAATQIHNNIRGLSPTPGAFTMWRGKRLKILRTQITTDQPNMQQRPAIIGTVNRQENSVQVQCGTGLLSLRTVQLEGKPACDIDAFIKGHPELAGSVLSSGKRSEEI